MIKLLNTIVVNTEIEVSFTPEVKTYNIVTGFMSDNCRPFRVSVHIMIWITEEGYIGEIECIYPETVDTPLCSYSHDLSRKLGFPQIEICSCDNEAYIQHCDEGFTIWLNKEKMINKIIDCNQFLLLVSGDELVAVKTQECNIVE